jgi:hypothetical protein
MIALPANAQHFLEKSRGKGTFSPRIFLPHGFFPQEHYMNETFL